MAVMEKLRRNVFGVFGTIILFILLILMVWGDASSGGGNINLDANVAGYVNDEKISYNEFSGLTDFLTDFQRRQNPEQEIDQDQMQEQVWEMIWQEKLLQQAASEFGIEITAKELANELYENPPQMLRSFFVDSAGQFNPEVYRQFMSNVDAALAQNEQMSPQDRTFYKNYILFAERQLKTQMLQKRLTMAIGSLYPRSSVLMRDKFERDNTKASGSFLMLNASMISDDAVSVSDEEARDYYESHRPMYHQDAAKLMKYVMVRIGPSERDTQKVQRRFTRFNEAMSGAESMSAKDSVFDRLIESGDFRPTKFTGVSFTPSHELPAELVDTLRTLGPNSVIGPIQVERKTYYINVMDVRDSGDVWVKARHILFNSQEENDSVKSIAEDVAARARGGADFTELVTEYSDDQGSAQQGGDVGWFNEASPFVPEFKEAALDASVGQIVGPVKSQFGYHIIEVTDQTTRSYKLRALNFDVTVSASTKNQLGRKASQFRERVDDGEPFDSVAADLGLQALETPPVRSSNQPVVGSYTLAAFGWNGDVGDVSEVIRLTDGSMVVAQVVEEKKEGPTPFEDVKEQIIATLTTKKKVAQLKSKIEQMHAAIAESGDLTAGLSVDSSASIKDFSDVAPASTLPEVGMEPALSAALFQLEPGGISQPIKGERGYYIARVDSLSRPGAQDFEAKRSQFTTSTLDQARQTTFGRWFAQYQQKASIVRNWDR